MKKQILTLALMAIFAIGASAQNGAQNASEVIEKYRAIPKAQFQNLNEKELQEEFKTAVTAEEYQFLKGIKNAAMLLVETTASQREAILADLKSLDGYFHLDEETSLAEHTVFVGFEQIAPAAPGDSDNPDANTLVALNPDDIKVNIYAKGDDENLSEMLLQLNIVEKTVLAHLSGQMPKSKAADIVRLMLKFE